MRQVKPILVGLLSAIVTISVFQLSSAHGPRPEKSQSPNVATAAAAQVGSGDVMGDFNDDGAVDLMALYNYGNATSGLWVFPGSSDHSVSTLPYLVWKSTSGGFDASRARISAGDFNDDGISDVAALYDYGSATSGLWVFPGTSGRVVGASSPYKVWQSGAGSFDAGRARITGGDFNRDGISDVVALYDYGSATSGLWVFPGTSGRVVGASSPYKVWQSGAGSFDAGRARITGGDFNRDGISDVVALYDYGSATSGLWVFPGTSGRVVGASSPYKVWQSGAGSFDAGRARITGGDFNRDGISDVVALYDYGSATSGLWVFPGTSGRVVGASSPYKVWQSGAGSFDARRTLVAGGDFDLNGVGDVTLLYDYGSASSAIWVFCGTADRALGINLYRSWLVGPGKFDWGQAQVA